jgi:RNA polymerase sigma-70 factor (ECF subfamily)
LDVLFSRYRHLLSLVAYRVIGNHAEAEDAVQNCLLTVTDNVPGFEQESAFRCWLVRVLIDEAVTILAKQSSAGAILAKKEKMPPSGRP